MVPLSIPGGNNAGTQLRNTAMLATWVQVCMTVQFMMTNFAYCFYSAYVERIIYAVGSVVKCEINHR